MLEIFQSENLRQGKGRVREEIDKEIRNVLFLRGQLGQSGNGGLFRNTIYRLVYCICSVFRGEIGDGGISVPRNLGVSTAERESFVTGDTRRCARARAVVSAHPLRGTACC